MKNNIKLFFKSLISNNSCIDAGRKKPWYAAILVFFFSIIVAIVPTFVQQIKQQGSDVFNNISYGADAAFVEFGQHINENSDLVMTVEESPTSDNNYLRVVNPSGNAELFVYKNAKLEPLFYFYYVDDVNADDVKLFVGEGKNSVIIFSQDYFYSYLVNPNTREKIGAVGCLHAYKYMDVGFNLKSLLSNETDATLLVEGTMSNWKQFYKDAYNYDRLTNLWQQCLLIGGIDIVITAIMGFMIWILTRGKNNPYRYLGVWETQKIAYWSTITPALLTCGLGFLISSATNILFPLLIGVRVMWLTMKSFRADGTGYAAS